jgi:hypothetical protein
VSDYEKENFVSFGIFRADPYISAALLGAGALIVCKKKKGEEV